jgi:uncharacterized protein involved in exopolysaccharide biosynthesis
MPPESDGLPLLTYAAMVWRRRVLVLIATLGMAVPAFAVSALQPPVYQSSASLLLAQQELDANSNIGTAELTDRQMNTQVALLTSDEVGEAARRHGATTVVRALTATNSNVITLTATTTDPAKASATVEAYARAYAEYRIEQARRTIDEAAAELEERIGRLQEQIRALPRPEQRAALEPQQANLQAQLGRLQTQRGLVGSGVITVRKPNTPTSPISPTPVRDALLAMVVGLVLGISLAVLLETLRLRRTPRAGDSRHSSAAHAWAPSPPSEAQVAVPMGAVTAAAVATKDRPDHPSPPSTPQPPSSRGRPGDYGPNGR